MTYKIPLFIYEIKVVVIIISLRFLRSYPGKKKSHFIHCQIFAILDEWSAIFVMFCTWSVAMQFDIDLFKGCLQLVWAMLSCLMFKWLQP